MKWPFKFHLAISAVIGGVLLGAAACEASRSECRSDTDCNVGYSCVSTGGILFRGGRCIADSSQPVPVDTHVRDTTDATPQDSAAVDSTVVDSTVVDSATVDSTPRDTAPDPPDGSARDVSELDARDTSAGRAGDPCERDRDCRSGHCRVSDAGASGKCAHRIVVTPEPTNGDLGGVTEADSRCNELTAADGLEGNWRAVLKTEQAGALARIEFRGPVVNYVGDPILEPPGDTTAPEIEIPVEFDTSGESRSVDVWTGVAPFETGTTPVSTCADWTTTSLVGYVGHSDRDDDDWISDDQEPCDREAHLYCIDGQ